MFVLVELRLPSERPATPVVTSSASAFLGPDEILDCYVPWGYIFCLKSSCCVSHVTLGQLRTASGATAADVRGTTSKCLGLHVFHGVNFQRDSLVCLKTCPLGN